MNVIDLIELLEEQDEDLPVYFVDTWDGQCEITEVKRVDTLDGDERVLLGTGLNWAAILEPSARP